MIMIAKARDAAPPDGDRNQKSANQNSGRSALTVGFSDIAESTIRVTRIRRGIYVEFEYSLSDELLVVELVMPYPAFVEFCTDTKARLLDPEADAAGPLAALAARFKSSSQGGRIPGAGVHRGGGNSL
ncbi:MAG: phenol hydroxylase subunit [Hyphomicrobiales bacterium]